MFGLPRRSVVNPEVERLAAVLVDEPACSAAEVFRRCRAADDLAALGPTAAPALPALLRSLVVRVTVDCGLVLRVAAAAAVWRVDRRFDVALPFLAWALKDEYWGVPPRAVAVLSEIGHPAVVPDLIRLAGRRLAHGPFHFEMFAEASGDRDSKPLLAAVAAALGRCARGRWEGDSCLKETRGILIALADCGDGDVRAAALAALSGLGDTA